MAKRKPKLREQPGLAFRARWLTHICTESLVEYLCTPTTKATRTLRSLVAAEVLYRMNIRNPVFPRHHVFSRDINVFEHAWRLYHGDAPIPHGWGPASTACPEMRAWAALDEQVH
ncbi:MAG: hypothetical protein ACJ8R9_02525 [Steroidobacteraceae bacterium]